MRKGLKCAPDEQAINLINLKTKIMSKPKKTATGLTIIHEGARVHVYFDREIKREEHKILNIVKKLIRIK